MHIALVFLLLIIVACGSPETERSSGRTGTAPETPAPAPPSVEEAATLIRDSPDFGDYQFTHASLSMPLEHSAMSAPLQESADDLVKAGWLRARDGKVALTAKASSDRRFLMRPNGTLDIVPLAKKEFGTVRGVQPTLEGVDATFSWRWVPNEVGKGLVRGDAARRFAEEQVAVATLIRSGSGWMILRIKPQEQAD